MGHTISDHERLPWLEPVRPVAPRKTPVAANVKTVLMILLALLVGSALAIMAYFTGIGTAPVESQETAAPVAMETPRPTPTPSPLPLAPAPPPTPVVPLPIVPPAPAIATPAPVSEPVRRVTSKRVTSAKATRTASARRAAIRRAAARRAAARSSSTVVVHRNATPARVGTVAPRRPVWTLPLAPQPSGRVIQLGAYRNWRQTAAAWRRLVRVYPYLSRLPRTTMRSRTNPPYYRLRLYAGSPRNAGILCDNLHRIGRGCIVV